MVLPHLHVPLRMQLFSQFCSLNSYDCINWQSTSICVLPSIPPTNILVRLSILILIILFLHPLFTILEAYSGCSFFFMSTFWSGREEQLRLSTSSWVRRSWTWTGAYSYSQYGTRSWAHPDQPLDCPEYVLVGPCHLTPWLLLLLPFYQYSLSLIIIITHNLSPVT